MSMLRGVEMREALRDARKRNGRVCRGLRALIWDRSSKSLEAR